MSSDWHGILVDAAFVDAQVIDRFRKFAQKKDESWTISGVVIENHKLAEVLAQLQSLMRKDAPFYLHFYNNVELIVVFQDRIFRVTPDPVTWKPILDFSVSRAIPAEQLDFQPNQFADEKEYFKLEALLD